jgi:hypothetical protein
MKEGKNRREQGLKNYAKQKNEGAQKKALQGGTLMHAHK